MVFKARWFARPGFTQGSAADVVWFLKPGSLLSLLSGHVVRLIFFQPTWFARCRWTSLRLVERSKIWLEISEALKSRRKYCNGRTFFRGSGA